MKTIIGQIAGDASREAANTRRKVFQFRLRRNETPSPSQTSRLRVRCFLAVGLMALASSARAAGFFSDTFENYTIVPTNVAQIGNGWNATGTCTVAANVGLSNSQGMNVGAGAIAWNMVNSNAAPNRIWTDLWQSEGDFMTVEKLPLAVTSTVFMVSLVTNNTAVNGCLYVMNPSNSAWEACLSNATNGPVPTISTGNWVRISVFANYSNHTVAIFLNGVALRTNWPFINTNLTSCSNLVCEGGAGGNTFLDNVSVGTGLPAGLPDSDINGNQMPDALELTLYGSLNVWIGSTVTASVTNPAGGSLTPSGTLSGILYGATTNFNFSANAGYVLDKAWTNGVLATDFNRQGKTGSFTWSGITTDGTFQVGFYYNGIRYVPGDYSSLTDALTVAQLGDTLTVSNGTYAGSIAVSNGVTLVGTNMTGSAGDTNLVIQGSMTVVQTGTVYFAGNSGLLTVTGEVSVAAGGVLTISNAAASVGNLTIGVGGVVHVINGSLTVNGITKTGTFDVTLVTNSASVSGGNGSISPTGPFTTISWFSNVTYTLTANMACVPGPLTNNGSDVSASLVNVDTRHWTYTAVNLSSDQTITATFVYNGIRYVPGDYSTITDAVAAAVAGETIVVCSGAYAETVAVSSNLTMVGTNVSGLTALTMGTGVTVTVTGFANLSVAGTVTVATNGLLVLSNSVVSISNLTVAGGGTLQGYNSTATVNGVVYTGDFTFDQYGFIGLVAQPLNFSEGFETFASGQRLDHLGGHGWNASTPGVTVVSNPDVTSTNSTAQTAVVPVGAAVSNVVSGAGLGGGAGPANVWIDMMLRETMHCDSPEFIETNHPLVCYVNTNGWLTVLTPGGWDVCSNDAWGAAAPNLATGAWAQISCLMNFSTAAGLVSYFVNGHLVRASLPFANPANHIDGMRLATEYTTAWLDNVNIATNVPASVTNNWPAVADLDHSGIADAEEIQRYGTLVTFMPRGSVFKVR